MPENHSHVQSNSLKNRAHCKAEGNRWPPCIFPSPHKYLPIITHHVQATKGTSNFAQLQHPKPMPQHWCLPWHQFKFNFKLFQKDNWHQEQELQLTLLLSLLVGDVNGWQLYLASKGGLVKEQQVHEMLLCFAVPGLFLTNPVSSTASLSPFPSPPNLSGGLQFVRKL